MALTRDAIFFDAFTNHAGKSVEASKLLVGMLDDPEHAGGSATKIKDLEHEADKITHDCVAHLHQTWITPLDREEIHALITHLDDVMDSIEAASERVVLFEIKQTNEEGRALSKALVKSCEAM